MPRHDTRLLLARLRLLVGYRLFADFAIALAEAPYSASSTISSATFIYAYRVYFRAPITRFSPSL